MQTLHQNDGVTWIKRFGVAATSAAMAASLVVAPIGPDESPPPEPGQLSTSMVEMLDHDDQGRVLTLASLRAAMLGPRAASDAGTGIDVALIDTGVAPVDGLDGGNVLHGPDLSGEGSSPDVAYLDTYGHGTHMAGIIAGDRNGAPGIAPGARIVSLKVAGHDGVTTVPQVVAAIDWVVEHRKADGLNIRVLNLSLGQQGVTSHVGDHLSAAVERAWNAGIVVVVAGGNRGDMQDHLDSPAIDPYVVAVGATEIEGNFRDLDPSVPKWSAMGDGKRNPDVVAPGRSIVSYRVPGSTVDVAAPHARQGANGFLGSGTSQAAAVTSGLAAALLSEDPSLNPDEVKHTIEYWAEEVDDAEDRQEGEGGVDGYLTVRIGWPGRGNPSQDHTPAAGGSTGIVTPSGGTWSGGTWSGGTWSGATWSGATWSGGTWSGATWSGATWSGATWSGATWSGGTWSGATWSGGTWSGATWSGGTWSGNGWN